MRSPSARMASGSLCSRRGRHVCALLSIGWNRGVLWRPYQCAAPNQALQPMPSSVCSYLAPASLHGLAAALGVTRIVLQEDVWKKDDRVQRP